MRFTEYGKPERLLRLWLSGVIREGLWEFHWGILWPLGATLKHLGASWTTKGPSWRPAGVLLNQLGTLFRPKKSPKDPKADPGAKGGQIELRRGEFGKSGPPQGHPRSPPPWAVPSSSSVVRRPSSVRPPRCFSMIALPRASSLACSEQKVPGMQRPAL